MAALLTCLFGQAVLRGESMARMDVFCDDPAFLPSCGTAPPDARQNDYSPALVNYPYEAWNGEELRRGRLSGWNPRVALGAPTALTFQGSAPNPLRLPFYLVPGPRSHDLSLIAQIWVAGIFAFLLARRLGAGDAGGLYAGLAYAFSGYVQGYAAFSIAASAACLPVVAFAVECLVSERTTTAMLGTGLSFALAATVGHPSTNFLTPIAASIFLVARAAPFLLTAPGPEARRLLALIGGAGLLCAAIAAASWVGFGELLGQGYTYKTETRGEKVLETARQQAQRLKWVSFLAPRAFFDFTVRWREAVPFPHFVVPYVGIGTMALGAYALLTRRTPIALLPLFVFALAVTYGPGPLARVQRLPGFDKIYYYYCLYLLALPIAVWAGLGLDAVMRRGVGGGAVVALITGIIVATAMNRVGFASPVKHAAQWKQFVAEQVRTAGGFLTYFRHAVAFGLLAAAVGLAPSLRRFSGPVLTGAALLEILWNTAFLRERGLPFDFEPSPALRQVMSRAAAVDAREGPGTARMTGSDWRDPMVNGASVLGLRDLRQTDALQIGRYTSFMKALDPTNEKNFPTFRVTTKFGSPLLDLAGVRFVIRERSGASAANYWKWRDGYRGEPSLAEPTLGGDPERPLVFSADAVGVYENRRAMPRAFLVQSARVTHGPEQAGNEIRLLGGPGKGTLAVDGVAVLDGPDAPPMAATLRGPRRHERDTELVGTAERGRGRARLREEDVDHLVVETAAPEPSILVVADSYYPGWRAAVDGAPAPIVPADLAMRAVAVPAGSHVVTMTYRPVWRFVAAFVSYPACVGACVAWVVLRLRRRRLALAAAA